MSDMAKSSGDAGGPLSQLPAELHPVTGLFYAIYSDILKGQLGLATRIGLWMQSDGLTVGEVTTILRRLMRPEHAAAVQFPGQLVAALAEGVAAAVKERKAAAEEAERRRRWEADHQRFAVEGEPIGGKHEPTL